MQFIRLGTFFSLFICLAACVEEKTVVKINSAEVAPLTTIIDFAGIDSIDGILATTLRLNWTMHPDAVGYLITVLTNGSTYEVTDNFQTSYLIRDLKPETEYVFSVNAIDSDGNKDLNVKTLTFTTGPLDPAPDSLSLVFPSRSPGNDRSPIIRVGGVSAGLTVKLYLDKDCEIESGSALAAGATVDIQSSNLQPGIHTFYATVINATLEKTECSTAALQYIYRFCPDGYVEVPGNLTLGVSTYCAMKWEAKAWNDADTDDVIDPGEVDADGCNEPACSTANWGIATHKPISTAEGFPWRRINADDAWNECDSLNSEVGRLNIDADLNTDGTYALMSNPEWMTMARNMENVADNWTSGQTGTGCMVVGNVNSLRFCSSDSKPISYTGPTPDGGINRFDNGLATLQLTNGEILWDVSGNIGEWVDWELTNSFSFIIPGDKAFVAADGGPTGVLREFTQLDSNILTTDSMFPDSWKPQSPLLGSANGLGGYRAGTNVAGGYPARGGNYGSGSFAGVYALKLQEDNTYTHPNRGFRCVFRP